MIHGKQDKKGKGWADSNQLNEIEAVLNNVNSPDGTILITRNAGGIALQAVSQGNGGIPVQVTGLYSGTPSGPTDVKTFTGNVYANGPNASATSTGVVVKFFNFAPAETIPDNTFVIASKIRENPLTDGNGDNILDPVTGQTQSAFVYWSETGLLV